MAEYLDNNLFVDYWFFLLFVIDCRGSGHAVQIVQRHHFASYLKRMAVVVRMEEEFLAFVKVYAWIDH